MFYIASILLIVFVTNVVLGSFGFGGFLNEVGEMLTLLAASIAFVAAILKREAAAKAEEENNKS